MSDIKNSKLVSRLYVRNKKKYTSKMSCNNIENSNKITAARQTCRLVFSAQKTHWRKRRHRITAEALNNSSLTAM